MVSKRSIATRHAVRSSSVGDSGTSFTAQATGERFGAADVVDARDGARTSHHRSAAGDGR